MQNKTFYNEILTEHNRNPYHKHPLKVVDLMLEGVNPSCGDDIFLNLKMNGDVIEDASFQGDGCAISQASADMMIDLVLGKTKQEALELADRFLAHGSAGKPPRRKKSPWTKPPSSKTSPTCPPASNALPWAGTPSRRC